TDDAWAAAEARRDGGDDAAAAGPVLRVQDARTCYVCKVDFHDLHHFYDQLCPACADLNWRKRNQTADLRGRVALVTGGRVKIGYQAAIKMLHAGAETIVITRFPIDAARRFAEEPDAPSWRGRLHIYGVDLRHTPSVEALCAHMRATWSRLDVLINNACQTVRRPSGFYDHLMAAELEPWRTLPPAVREPLERWEALRADRALAAGAGEPAVALAPSAAAAPGMFRSAVMSQLPLLAEDLERGGHLYPQGRLDADLQQVDLREFNSWRMTLADVPTAELLEVQLVNAVAPFVLNARLRPLLAAVPTDDAHVVNVSAMEGQFYRRFKTDKHPHTNMAKAALNMLTRTSAIEYVRDGIHMNSVDTGWVTDEDPVELARRKVEVHRFSPPLDIVDGAARICDPPLAGVNSGEHLWGLFLKDYKPTPW
ncbi:MAG: SDR family oxidoreductase, partial [Myxococcales bacterium]|nr:SDR family oxidoreductase [Myxococcales bacterium]